MGQRNDCKLNALQTQLAKTGQLNDLFLEWLQANGATSDDLNDAQIEMLVSQGYTEGSLNDRWYVFLGVLGYTGALADRFQRWWCGESGDGSDGGQIVSYLINLPLLINRYNTGDNAYNATLDRNSAATVIDHEGIVRTCLPNEFRFQGARRVENQAGANQDMTNGNWQKIGATVTAGNVIEFSSNFDRVLYGFVFDANVGDDVSICFKVRSLSGPQVVYLPYGANYGTSFSIDDDWVIIQRIFSNISSNEKGGISTFNSSILPYQVEVADIRFEVVTGQTNQAPSEIVTPNDSACSVSDIPVRYFDTTNGNTVDVNGVVTEATGSAITPDGLLIEESSTNLFLNDNGTQDITTTAQAYTVSVTGTGSITLTGTMSGVATAGSPVTATATAGTLTCTVSGDVGIGQVEANGYATSAIPTTNASATRLADNAQTLWPADLVNDFVIECEVIPKVNDITSSLFKPYTNASNEIRFQRNALDVGFGGKRTGGVNQNVTGDPIPLALTKAQLRISATQGADIFIAGVKGTNAPDTADVPDFTTTYIGQRGANTQYLNGNIKNISLRKGDLTDDEVING